MKLSALRARAAAGLAARALLLASLAVPVALLVVFTASPARAEDRQTTFEEPTPTTSPGLEENEAGVRTIVLDPGHGGDEVGAVGHSGLMEKNVALDICKRLRALLEGRDGYRVILTREDDRQLPLRTRTAIANNARADLFVSIHLNSSRRTSAHGTEAYFLSLTASDEEAMSLAQQENLAGPEDGDEEGGGGDAGVGEGTEGREGAGAGANDSSATKSDLKLVLWGMAQAEHLNQSSRLAELIQDQMDRLHGMESRGVKQAPFAVLMGATMPAVLVEVAFLSNPDDEKKLASDDFRENVAKALETAINQARTEFEQAGRPRQAPPAAGPP